MALSDTTIKNKKIKNLEIMLENYTFVLTKLSNIKELSDLISNSCVSIDVQCCLKVQKV